MNFRPVFCKNSYVENLLQQHHLRRFSLNGCFQPYHIQTTSLIAQIQRFPLSLTPVAALCEVYTPTIVA